MADQFNPPANVQAEEAGVSGPAQMAAAVVAALITLAMLNAHGFAAWADGLEPGARSARIGTIAHGLADHSVTSGLDIPRAALHDTWIKVKAARWAGQAPEE